jgi:FkbM family methyltransferase
VFTEFGVCLLLAVHPIVVWTANQGSMFQPLRMKLRRNLVFPCASSVPSRLVVGGMALVALVLASACLSQRMVVRGGLQMDMDRVSAGSPGAPRPVHHPMPLESGKMPLLPIANKEKNHKAPLCDNPSRLGDEYGGWTICVPKTYPLNGTIVYSVGVGRNIKWDEAMIAAYGTQHHGFDPTPTAIDYFQKRSPPAGYVFHKYGLGVVDGKVDVQRPIGNNDSFTVLKDGAEAKPDAVTTIDVLKLESMLKMLGHKEIEILKADIEGAEFDVIADWAARNYRPPAQQILIEFHDRFFSNGRAKLRKAVQDMKSIGFVLVHKQKNWVRIFRE